MVITQTEIEAIIAKVGAPHGTKPFRKVLDLDFILGMVELGYSLRQIADYLGVCHSTISRRIKNTDRSGERAITAARNALMQGLLPQPPESTPGP
jgi:hypothetical protein